MENKGVSCVRWQRGRGGLEGDGGRIPDGSESRICFWRGRGGRKGEGTGGGMVSLDKGNDAI